ncbi:hypothetical protein [Duganella sp. HH101]|nr:hypothetical protein [Duganella sp. HH101]
MPPPSAAPVTKINQAPTQPLLPSFSPFGINGGYYSARANCKF